MLHNVFIGGKTGHHDRILDFSTAITGAPFFAPSNSLLAFAELAADEELASGLLES